MATSVAPAVPGKPPFQETDDRVTQPSNRNRRGAPNAGDVVKAGSPNQAFSFSHK